MSVGLNYSDFLGIVTSCKQKTWQPTLNDSPSIVLALAFPTLGYDTLAFFACLLVAY